MGLFKSIGNISEAIKNVTDIIDEAVVDKDKLIEIKNIRLLKKRGGKSGDFIRNQ